MMNLCVIVRNPQFHSNIIIIFRIICIARWYSAIHKDKKGLYSN